ncbi:MAG TPA: DUF924 family protein [Steroidobacteraceae bacterium]|nr:DUF924 family protein [Steroidobacteraceae bacterium]
MPSAQDVLSFWFGPRPHGARQVAQRMRLWFADRAAPELMPQTDELIGERFGALMAAAARDELSAWDSSPRRRLALILLLDPFPRHVYRGTAAACAQDGKALSLAVSGMQFGADGALDPVERIFFYLPLMHAESLDVQEESLAAFRRLRDEAPVELRAYFETALRLARQHHDIIARFGRFPQRNPVLGRADTAAEREWREQEPEAQSLDL